MYLIPPDCHFNVHHNVAIEFYVQVRHLDVKKEKEVQRESLVKFLLDAIATQFRNPSLWS